MAGLLDLPGSCNPTLLIGLAVYCRVMVLWQLIGAAALAACAMLTLSGWSDYLGTDGEISGNEAPTSADREVEPDYEALADEQLEQFEREAVSQSWVCSYAPSLDRDWHNDVTCTNGVDTETPYLRPQDSFITESEMLAAAKEYQDQLNESYGTSSGRGNTSSGENSASDSRLDEWLKDAETAPE